MLLQILFTIRGGHIADAVRSYHISIIFFIYLNHPKNELKLKHKKTGQQTTVFCVRCGTARGVQVYWLRSETHRDMAAWARALVQGSHNAVNYQREFSFRCLYQGRPCQLVVHLNRGFSLYECGYNSPSSQKTQLWQFPFDKLKGSADDGTRLLYLDFGDDGEISDTKF
uniref:Syntrophin C-terminal PH domain-containing protein n=1 Tax=Megaselia scalaris TaxID=36166 RepID=T1GTS2_MEGSC